MNTFFKRYASSVFCVYLLALTAPPAPAQNGPVVWSVPGLARIKLTDQPAASSGISLYAAKGEVESFQVVVRAPSTGLTNVNLTASDLVGPGTAVISKSELTFYREHYINVTKPTKDDGYGNRPLGAGLYADALIPFIDPATKADISGATYDAVPARITASMNQPFWIDVNVPRDATPGLYNGTVTVTSTQGAATVNVSLKVWSFSLPVKPALKSSFGYHGAQIGDKRNQELLIQHRLMPFLTTATFSQDFSTRIGLNSTGLPFFSNSNVANCTISAPPSVSSIRSSVQQFAAGVDTYIYAADEIDPCPSLFEGLKAWSRNAHAAGTKILTTVTPNPSLYDDGSGTGRSAVDIWVLLPKMHHQNTSRVAEVLAKGDEVWSYNCLNQDPYSPKWLIDFAPINYRIQPGFLNQRFGFSGLLYWGLDEWTSDPWNNPHSPAQEMFAGEGMLVYPGQQAGISGVVPSMRLKWLRDGVDDYDYVQLLKAAGRGDWAAQIVSSTSNDWINWTKDPEVLDSARIELGEELSRLGGDSAPPVKQLVISSIAISGITANAATITWSTDQPADSQIEWGLTTAYGTLTTLDPKLVSNHSATLTGLLPGQRYSFRVRSKSVDGKSAISNGLTFTTLPTVAVQQPSPTDKATKVSRTVTLGWAAVPGATSYSIYGGTSASSMPLIGTATTNRYRPGTLKANTTYYWKVVVKVGTQTYSSSTWSLTTGS